MPGSRPPHLAEFREQMVDLFHAGRTLAELSREFGVSKQNAASWIKQAGRTLRIFGVELPHTATVITR